MLCLSFAGVVSRASDTTGGADGVLPGKDSRNEGRNSWRNESEFPKRKIRNLEEDGKIVEEDERRWSPLMLGILPNWPAFSLETHVYGLKLGLPACAGDAKLYGLEPSVFYSGTRNVKGLQVSALGASVSSNLCGVQLSSLGPSVSDDIKGVQLVGTVGISLKKAVGAQIAPVTVSCGKLMGIQIGAVNVSRKNLMGVQSGVVNVGAKVRGLQIGLVNYNDGTGKMIQLGLVNVIKDGWLPFTILLNFKFDHEKEKK